MEQTLLLVPIVQAFKIPPRQSSRGYRAADWDVNNMIWSGRLRIVSIGDNAHIRLEDPNTGELFANSPYDAASNTVEPTADSSRYFVIRLEDITTKQHAFIGIGFLDRNQAFDFNVTLQDHHKQTMRIKQGGKGQPNAWKTDPNTDFRLKEGEMLSIKIPGGSSSSKTTGSQAAAPFALPPPPGASTVIQNNTDPFGLAINASFPAPAIPQQSNPLVQASSNNKSNGNVPQGWVSFQ